MVYDVARGKFKRRGGAYGRKPLDMVQRPPVEPSKPNELCPMVCGIWSTYRQFALPHDIKLSNDGLAYVADRGNKPVQVLTPEGKFVAEQVVGVDSKFTVQTSAVAFSP